MLFFSGLIKTIWTQQSKLWTNISTPNSPPSQQIDNPWNHSRPPQSNIPHLLPMTCSPTSSQPISKISFTPAKTHSYNITLLTTKMRSIQASEPKLLTDRQTKKSIYSLGSLPFSSFSQQTSHSTRSTSPKPKVFIPNSWNVFLCTKIWPATTSFYMTVSEVFRCFRVDLEIYLTHAAHSF